MWDNLSLKRGMREGGDTITAFLSSLEAASAAQLIAGEIRRCSRGLGRFPNERKAAGYIPRHCSHRM